MSNADSNLSREVLAKEKQAHQISDLAMKLAKGFGEAPDIGLLLGGYGNEKRFGDTAKGVAMMPAKGKPLR